MRHRPDLCAQHRFAVARRACESRRLMSLMPRQRLERVLEKMLDENEFLSPYGLRGVSRFHREHPFVLHRDGQDYRVDYEPAESTTGLFGGNSNWRGPVWFPMNYLMIESLQRYHYYYGDDLQSNFPPAPASARTWAKSPRSCRAASREFFFATQEGRRPVFGGMGKFQNDPHFRDYVWFNEYFHGDNGAGIGANHQTGWTALVAKLLQQSGE